MNGRVCTDPECFIDTEYKLRATTATELIRELEHLIRRCLQHGACYFIVEAPDVHRYVQGLIDRLGRFVVESVSNTSLGSECAGEHGLSDADQLRLIRLGWSAPDASSPNWYREVNPSLIAPSPLVAELLVRTLVEVHHAEPSKLGMKLGHARGSGRVPSRKFRDDESPS
ncbi:MAG: hypothetical protein JOZ99_15700 [Actinobacteria bacterium]|nr:hypothetical protein [Actinomycetota bacterium]